MYSRSHFLSLPRELRDMIYKHYAAIPGGYLYDFERRKFTTMDHEPVDLALGYTCTLVAREMWPIPLSCNTLTFTTVYSEELRLRAGLFDVILEKQYCLQKAMLKKAASQVTNELENEFSQSYPEFAEFTKDWKALDDPNVKNWRKHFLRAMCYWADARSRTRQINRGIVQKLASLPGFSAPPLLDILEEFNIDALKEIVTTELMSWHIPSRSELRRLANLLDEDPAGDDHRRPPLQPFNRELGHDQPDVHWRSQRWNPDDLSKWRFSAASAAIHFLGSLSWSQRSHIREIVLVEDYEAVAYPQSHALGLIPFCQENKRLHIDRRVHIWKNMLMQESACNQSLYERVRYSSELIDLRYVARSSFSPCPTPESASQPFRCVQDQAFIQKCFKEAVKRNLPQPDAICDNIRRVHNSTFITAVEETTTGKSSRIRCNFDTEIDPGETFDIEGTIERHRGYSFSDWYRCVRRLRRGECQTDTVPPLPSFIEIRKESTLWDEEYERKLEERMQKRRDLHNKFQNKQFAVANDPLKTSEYEELELQRLEAVHNFELEVPKIPTGFNKFWLEDP
ncbi:unnamed protein product [Periconia digitata]|uniref:Uncharacterized protein n=1 Tax=Periconia digitata TaxID=1303443 RepID=A0A9W4XM11_9PLEO|nr:unnamed protein product [Periconia digitata]